MFSRRNTQYYHRSTDSRSKGRKLLMEILQKRELMATDLVQAFSENVHPNTEFESTIAILACYGRDNVTKDGQLVLPDSPVTANDKNASLLADLVLREKIELVGVRLESNENAYSLLGRTLDFADNRARNGEGKASKEPPFVTMPEVSIVRNGLNYRLTAERVLELSADGSQWTPLVDNGANVKAFGMDSEGFLYMHSGNFVYRQRGSTAT
ncbi:MAG: hypothetical protein KDB03_03140, partial [Planctomycetales bacterium]|nr:hypothetical protein [Planctomycetales bacterium]